MTNNSGCDKKENPYIPFREYLADVWNGIVKINPRGCKKQFDELVSDMLLKEIRFLPRIIKLAAMDVCVEFVKDLEYTFALNAGNKNTKRVELKSVSAKYTPHIFGLKNNNCVHTSIDTNTIIYADDIIEK